MGAGIRGTQEGPGQRSWGQVGGGGKVGRYGGGYRGEGGLAVHTQGGAHGGQCIHKAVHTKGGPYPTQESCYLSGDGGAGPRIKRREPFVERSEPRQWNVWRFTHKSVPAQGGAHNRHCVATARVLLFTRGCEGWPPREAKRAKARFGDAHTKWCTHKVGHTQGNAHTRRCVATARILLFKAGVHSVAPTSSESRRGTATGGGGYLGEVRGGFDLI